MSGTYAALVQKLVRNGVLATPNIIRAFRSANREDFVLPRDRSSAGADAPLLIGFGATISQPTTVAMMVELLGPKPGDRVLDVGSGSGWAAAVLARCVAPSGRVTGIELVPELVELARSNLTHAGMSSVEIRPGSGYEGIPELAPFDVIHVAAAAPAVPQQLVDQLTEGGRMVMPVGSEVQELVLLQKKHGAVTQRRYPGFQFVPLVQ